MSQNAQKTTVPDSWQLHPLIDQDERFRKSGFRYLNNHITSLDTKQTYRRALTRLLAHCEALGLDDLLDVEASHIKAYVEGQKELGKTAGAKSSFYAAKGFFQQCVDDGHIAVNPAGSVAVKFKKPKSGKTRRLTSAQVNTLILSIPDLSDVEDNPPKETDLRDRALISLMAYTFARIGGALSCRVKDFYFDEEEWWLRMIEKGDEEHEVFVPKAAAEKLRDYIRHCKMTDPQAWLFQSANRNGKLSGKPYDRSNSRDMIARRAKHVLGEEIKVSNHTFRVTGITNALDRGISYELVQEMANHKDAETTKLYDRTRSRRTVKAMKDFDYE